MARLDRKASADAFVDGLEQVGEVREDVGVGFVQVLGHQVPVDAYVKLAVGSGQQIECLDVIALSGQGFTRHPGGSQRMPSIVAVEYLYLQGGSFGHDVLRYVIC